MRKYNDTEKLDKVAKVYRYLSHFLLRPDKNSITEKSFEDHNIEAKTRIIINKCN